MFDAVVISGEVGMRKPEPEIFAHVLDLLGVRAEETVFVDDLRQNVEAADALGLVGVHHTTYADRRRRRTLRAARSATPARRLTVRQPARPRGR